MEHFPMKPVGQSFVISGTPAAGGATLVGGPTEGEMVFRFHNPSTARGWLGYGMSSTAAQTNAVVPSPGVPTSALPLTPAAVSSYTLGPGIFVCAVMEQGSATISGAIGWGI